MKLSTILCCPTCGHKHQEDMPENVTYKSYTCPSCKTLNKTKDDECCIYCSYGDFPCPQAQVIGSACCSPD